MEQCFGNGQETACTGRETSATFQIIATEASVRLVPNVLKRLFLFVGEADNVCCHPVQWLIRSVACSQLHIMIAEPQSGFFLLKWPLRFHNREDSYHYHRQLRYLDAIRYNVSLKVPPTEIIAFVQIFLAGYEKMLLDEVHASALNLYYCDLHTFMVDFSMYNDKRMCNEEQSLLVKRKTAECNGFNHEDNDKEVIHDDWCFATHDVFLGNWQQWAQTITAITDSCGATLSHFVFGIDSYTRDFTYKFYTPLHLPKQLYKSLNFDRMLSRMPNLRTLYLPIHAYNNAFHDDPEVPMDLDVVWPVVRNMPSNQLLPSLQRIVVLEGGKCNRSNGNMSGGCTFSNMPLASSEITIEGVADCGISRQETKTYSKALKFVTRYNDKLLITPVRTDNEDYREATFVEMNNNPESGTEIIEEILHFVNKPTLVGKRQLKLSVWNDTMQCSSAKKAVIVLQIADLCKKVPDDLVESFTIDVMQTLVTLTYMLKKRCICPTAVRVVIEEINLRSTGRWGWGVMYQILPFFAVDDKRYSETVAGDDEVLHAIRLNMKMGQYFTSFGDKVQLWYRKAKKRKIGFKSMFTERYKFPGIHLTIDSVVDVDADAAKHFGDATFAEAWVEAVEYVIKCKIGWLLFDAVDSCVKRDLSYDLYRSLKRIEYEFHIKIDYSGQDGADEKLLEKITLLLQSRAAEFERRGMDESLIQMVHSIDADRLDFNEQQLLFWRLAGLVRQKFVNIELVVFEQT